MASYVHAQKTMGGIRSYMSHHLPQGWIIQHDKDSSLEFKKYTSMYGTVGVTRDNCCFNDTLTFYIFIDHMKQEQRDSFYHKNLVLQQKIDSLQKVYISINTKNAFDEYNAKIWPLQKEIKRHNYTNYDPLFVAWYHSEEFSLIDVSKREYAQMDSIRTTLFFHVESQ